MNFLAFNLVAGLFLLIGIIIVGGLILIAIEVKNAPYFDEETNRFIPKEEEKEYEEKIAKHVEKYLKETLKK